jgi:hypothetical protein
MDGLKFWLINVALWSTLNLTAINYLTPEANKTSVTSLWQCFIKKLKAFDQELARRDKLRKEQIKAERKDFAQEKSEILKEYAKLSNDLGIAESDLAERQKELYLREYRLNLAKRYHDLKLERYNSLI